MEWFVNEFKPFVDKNYRTLRRRENTFIAGSSMGGLMSVYALLEYNHVFSRAAALSPSLWVAPEQIHNLITMTDLNPDTILYMDYGSDEFGTHTNLNRAFGEIAATMMRKNILLDCRIVPGGTHCEACWERQLPFFMHTLTYKYK